MSLAIRWGRHSTLLTAGSVSVIVMGLVSLVVFTRYLSPAEFGRLAIMLIFAASLTLLFNLGSLQGTLMVTYGAADEEAEGDERVTEIDRSRAGLGTGLLLTLGIVSLGTALVAVAAGPIAELLIGDAARADLVVLAAAMGGLGALWRLVINVVRLERRPGLYAVLNSVRPVLVVALAIPFLMADRGVGGVLAGMALGNTISVLVVLAAIRRSLSLRFDRLIVRRLLIAGSAYVPIILGYWTIQNADLFLLSRVASDADVGFYRLASRIGALASYGTAGFLSAWIPLQGTAAFLAVDTQHGRQAVRSRILASFVVMGAWVIVGFTAGAALLVKLAPESYRDAAPLIPLLATAFVMQGVMMTLYRSAAFPRRRQRYRLVVVGSAIAFLALCVPLAAEWEGTGAAVAVIAAFTGGAAALWALSQRGSNPLSIPYRRLGAALLLAGGCVALIEACGDAGTGVRIAVGAGTVLGFPVILLATRMIDLDHARQVARVAGALLPRRHATRRWGDLLGELGMADVLALREATRHENGEASGWTSALRRLTDTEVSVHDDGRLAQYLQSTAPRVERDGVADSLYEDGLAPAQLTVFETAFSDLRRLPRRAWDRAELEASVALRDRLAALDPTDAWWLELSVRHGWSTEQVADAFRVPVDAVGDAKLRALTALEPGRGAAVDDAAGIKLLEMRDVPAGRAESMVIDDLRQAPEAIWPVASPTRRRGRALRRGLSAGAALAARRRGQKGARRRLRR